MCVFDTIITNLLACFKWPVVWRMFLKLDGLLIKFLAEFYTTPGNSENVTLICDTVVHSPTVDKNNKTSLLQHCQIIHTCEGLHPSCLWLALKNDNGNMITQQLYNHITE